VVTAAISGGHSTRGACRCGMQVNPTVRSSLWTNLHGSNCTIPPYLMVRLRSAPGGAHRSTTMPLPALQDGLHGRVAAPKGTCMGMCDRVARWSVEALPQAWQLPQGAWSLSPEDHPYNVAWGRMVAWGVAIHAYVHMRAGPLRSASGQLRGQKRRPNRRLIYISLYIFRKLFPHSHRCRSLPTYKSSPMGGRRPEASAKHRTPGIGTCSSTDTVVALLVRVW
jgi:hypothetical protein